MKSIHLSNLAAGTILKALPTVLLAIALSGCVTNIPVEEYTMARAAYEAAKDADAARYAPAIWFDAEQSYRQGQKAFKDRRYADAKDAFKRAQEFSEQAENAAQIARVQSGEVIP